MFNHWVTILLTIAAVGGAIVTIYGWVRTPIRWFQSRPKSKVRQKRISLSFVSKDRHCRWSPVRGNDQSGTYIAGIWNVTNSSESDVVILKARLSKYQTQFVQVSTYNPSVEGFREQTTQFTPIKCQRSRPISLSSHPLAAHPNQLSAT